MLCDSNEVEDVGICGGVHVEEKTAGQEDWEDGKWVQDSIRSMKGGQGSEGGVAVGEEIG